MVKCCFFMIGLVVFIFGIIGLMAGIYNSWYYGELKVGVFLSPIAILFGGLFLWLSVKMERDEQETKRRKALRKAEEEELARKEKEKAEMEKAKKVFIEQKKWEKQLEKEEEVSFTYCTYCGNKLKSEQAYCEKCGAPTKEA